MTVFDHFAIASSAMRAFKLGMNVAGYNVANSNTVGFSRRRVDLSTMSAVAVPGGWSGMGVEVNSLTRIRDPFLDFAVRREAGRLGQDDARADILSALEPALGEAESAVLRSSISDFFDSIQNLVIDPSDMAIREDVVSHGERVAASIRSLDGHLVERRNHADAKAEEAVDRINELVEDLAQNNLEVTGLEAGGQEASDLRDQRDLLLDELSSLIPVNIVNAENGQVRVSLEEGGHTLVVGTSTQKLIKGQDSEGLMRIQVERAGGLADMTDSIRSGQLGGYLSVRDEDLVSYRSELDRVASALITEFNAVHSSGFDLNGDPGLAFFEPDPPGAHAANAIRVNSLIRADGSLIATSSVAGETGNNEIVLQLGELRSEAIAALNGRSFAEFSADLIASVGQDLGAAEASRDASLVIVDSLETKRQGVKGVSLDEEAAELARWQQSFAAAAKFMQVVNRVTETAFSIFP